MTGSNKKTFHTNVDLNDSQLPIDTSMRLREEGYGETRADLRKMECLRLGFWFLCLWMTTSRMGAVSASLFESSSRSSSGGSHDNSMARISLPMENPAYYQCTAPAAVGDADPALVYLPPFKSIKLLRMAASDTVCLLTRRERAPGSPVSSSVAPVGRSYGGHPWEAVAGPHPDLQFVCPQDSDLCEVTLPALERSDNDLEQEYVLAAYRYAPTSSKYTLARFLEQVTFGTTTADLEELSEAWEERQDQALAQWIHTQLYDVEPTSHRAYWRRRVHPRMNQPQTLAKPSHPCIDNSSETSRWRRFTFTAKDRLTVIYIHSLNNDGGAPYAMSVEGRIRTVLVNGDQLRFKNTDNSALLIPDTYYICNTPEEKVGGRLRLRRGTPDDNDGDQCQDLQLGNPIVLLTNEVIANGVDDDTDDNQKAPVVFDLPNIYATDGTNFELVPVTNALVYGEEMLLHRSLDEAQCDAVRSAPFDSFDVFFGRMQGTASYFVYDSRLELQENSLENPLSDGGGSVFQRTDGVVLCSNVPRSFLHDDIEGAGCQLSRSFSACSAKSGASEATFELNHDTIRTIQQVTERYVYSVHGLRLLDPALVEAGGQVLSPCTPEAKSRWIPLGEDGCQNTQNQTEAATVQILSKLLSEANDPNPNLRDIYFPETTSTPCAMQDRATLGMEIRDADGTCWKQVHPDHWNVHDMTYWTLNDTHPGNQVFLNASLPNPIKAFADLRGLSHLEYPGSHAMDRWEMHKFDFPLVGRFGDNVVFRDLPDELRLTRVAEALSKSGDNDNENGDNDSDESRRSGGVVTCGSPGEVANDPSLADTQDSFDVTIDPNTDTTARSDIYQQRKTVWTNVVMSAPDQLRQRVAWALSQIYPIAPYAGSLTLHTETYLQYYDIFVRNAARNIRDVLREVTFSPMMGSMLSYLQSKSTAYMFETRRRLAYPDENFAREFLQLFATGMVRLDPETGVPLRNEEEETISVYDNDDIMSFARAWTGFDRSEKRGNIEDYSVGSTNWVDTMIVDPQWRDKFPKRGLDGVYIGDRYPLCADLGPRHFLKRGARYRLLGSSSLPELQEDPAEWADERGVKRIVLEAGNSNLHGALCRPSINTGRCKFESLVELDSDLTCYGSECDVDTVRVVQVSARIFYEYVRPPCVEFPFYSNPLVVQDYRGAQGLCADPRLDTASEACCRNPTDTTDATRTCAYTGERLSFASVQDRCESTGGYVCGFRRASVCDDCCLYFGYYWTTSPCRIKIKVDKEGQIALVHSAGERLRVPAHVREDSVSYFRVDWQDQNFPSVQDGCFNGLCTVVDGHCLCDTTVVEKQVFQTVPSRSQALSQLRIGAIPDKDENVVSLDSDETPFSGERSQSGVMNDLDMSTTFRVVDDHGTVHFLKNKRSTVFVAGTNSTASQFSFRNPPHFMNLVDAELRDALYETEAVIDHIFHHPNTLPFISSRLIQRLAGISNPSPRYVGVVAEAFRKGRYDFSSSNGQSVTFGNGEYGDLPSAIAAILLDRESRDVVLDADGSHGSIREPLLKVIAFMRSMEFESRNNKPHIKLVDMKQKIGQMVHEIPTIFSFFLPDYVPPGPVTAAALVSPESQILTAHTVIGMLNGMLSLVKYGLSFCGEGFAERDGTRCNTVQGDYGDRGRLTLPSEGKTVETMVEEVGTLLTSGRLHEDNRRIITEMAKAERDSASSLRMIQQLMVTTPEFHATNLVRRSFELRNAEESNRGICRRYKAIVYLLLEGGADSYNMLMPHSECTSRDGMSLDEEYRFVRSSLAVDPDNMHTITADDGAQPCRTFGLHPRLPVLKELYDAGDALLLANTGVMSKPVDKQNYYTDTKTQLFAHDAMQREVQRINPFKGSLGTGVLGRMADVLTRKGLRTSSISLDVSSAALVGKPGRSPPSSVLSREGVAVFDPNPTSPHVLSAVKHLNSLTKVDSGLYGETWSSSLVQSLFENKILDEAVVAATVDGTFPPTQLGRQLEVVSRVVSARRERGVERDVLYVQLGGFDTHGSLRRLDSLFEEVNDAISAFSNEMKAKGLWDDVTFVATSDFARTLTPNSGGGSDHGWGGNYFVLGGEVKGGKIAGTYPDHLSESGPLNVGRGRLIPTTSWDAIWNGIAEWFGVESEEDLDEVLPNRRNFGSSLMNSADIYAPNTNENALVDANATEACSEIVDAEEKIKSSSCASVDSKFAVALLSGALSLCLLFFV